jgi:hypothetical protein
VKDQLAPLIDEVYNVVRYPVRRCSCCPTRLTYLNSKDLCFACQRKEFQRHLPAHQTLNFRRARFTL